MSAARLKLRGRAGLVTGAGRGIGPATAPELAARGAGGVVLVDLPGSELDAAGASPGDRALLGILFPQQARQPLSAGPR